MPSQCNLPCSLGFISPSSMPYSTLGEWHPPQIPKGRKSENLVTNPESEKNPACHLEPILFSVVFPLKSVKNY